MNVIIDIRANNVNAGFEILGIRLGRESIWGPWIPKSRCLRSTKLSSPERLKMDHKRMKGLLAAYLPNWREGIILHINVVIDEFDCSPLNRIQEIWSDRRGFLHVWEQYFKVGLIWEIQRVYRLIYEKYLWIQKSNPSFFLLQRRLSRNCRKNNPPRSYELKHL